MCKVCDCFGAPKSQSTSVGLCLALARKPLQVQPHFGISSASVNLTRKETTRPQTQITSTTTRTMSSSSPQGRNDLTESGLTIQSDSENYEANNELSSSSPPSSSSSPLILYSPPTVWGLLRGAAINLLLPFINGLMLGFGELFANEMAFRLGWSNTKVRLLHESNRTIWTFPFLALFLSF